MKTNSNINALAAGTVSFADIDVAIRRLNLKPSEQETLIADSLTDNLQRLVTIYDALKPLLTALTVLPLFPATWRRTLLYLKQLLDAIVAGAGGITANFKAGKDL